MKNGMASVMRSKTKNDDGDVLGGDVCFFFWLIWDCLLLYNLCTVYLYIHIHCIYLCFFGVGGRLGMNPRILTCKGVDPSLSMYFPSMNVQQAQCETNN